MYCASDSVIPATSARAAPARAGTTRAQSTVGPAQAAEQARYVVQLRVSAAPFEGARIPRLDIFDLYHLYTDVTVVRGRVWHVLRLGFFKQARTARTVARYLESYFEVPAIIRINAAAAERSLHNPLAARKDVGASGLHAVIELTAPADLPTPGLASQPRTARAQKPAARSLWSRLLGHR